MLVEDDPAYALLVEEMLRDALDTPAVIRAHGTLAEAREDLCSRGATACCSTSRCPTRRAGGPRKVQEVAPDVPVVVLSGQDDEEIAVQAVHEGAQDYLVKRDADAPPARARDPLRHRAQAGRARARPPGAATTR